MLLLAPQLLPSFDRSQADEREFPQGRLVARVESLDTDEEKGRVNKKRTKSENNSAWIVLSKTHGGVQ